jgi:hypothetical protein
MFRRIIYLCLIIKMWIALVTLCKLTCVRRVYMKKFKLVLILSLSLITIFSTVTFAADKPINVVLNDSKIDFPDAQPFVDANGRTQIPAKYIGEALGATVTWVGKEQKAVFSFGNKQLILYIGKKNYLVDGQTKQMDTTAIIKDGRTFVPAKYIAEALGANVKWDGSTKTVFVNRTLTTQAEAGKDVASGTVINNQAEFLEALKLATYTIQSTVVLKCNNYESSDYNFKNLTRDSLGLNGINSISINASTIGNVADMTATVAYSHVFKIQQAMKNELALSRLTTEDTLVLNKAKDIVSQVIKDSMTDYEKELAIHNYIVLNYKYDYDNYQNDTIPDESYSVYGLLINGTGVCQAYAEATELLLNMVGIECQMVTGISHGEAHGWNIVKLDDEYYMLDVTWDDPAPDIPGKTNYEYFNVAADQLSQDHTWDTSKWPIANGTKYNYFIYNNLIVNNYSEFQQLIIKKINEGEKDIWMYINNYDKNVFDLDFIFNFYYGSSIKHTVPTTTNTVYELILP